VLKLLWIARLADRTAEDVDPLASTLTLKTASTACRIWVLLVPGATMKVYLPSSASR
jgi:hypothetical protein